MFQKQPVMRKVLYSLSPLILFSTWAYGLRFAAVLALSLFLAVLTEFLFEKKRSGKVSEAVLVSAVLYALSLPPAVPLWIAALGICFGVFMAKCVYGGFGRNVFNVAIAARLFVYISFASALGSSWFEPGAFGMASGSLFGPLDGLSAATPLALLRTGGKVDILKLLLGLRPGSMGEAPIILIAAAAIYLLISKTASWRLMLSTIAGALATAGLLLLLGISQALPLEGLLAGSFLFVAVFMVTDPITAPKKAPAQLAYGFLVGSVVVIIRSFSLFPEGTSFAILIGNSFAAFFDKLASQAAERKKAKASSQTVSTQTAPSQSGAQQSQSTQNGSTKNAGGGQS